MTLTCTSIQNFACFPTMFSKPLITIAEEILIRKLKRMENITNTYYCHSYSCSFYFFYSNSTQVLVHFSILRSQSEYRLRVTCNRAGEKSQHNFSSMDAARALGGQINNVFGWRADMKNFDMEVLLNIRNDCVLVMVALNKESLFKRNICAFGPTTMRPTMCYCMAALAQPKRGDIILDPMCGGGSIPLEGALAYDGCLFIGADIHPKAMQRCSENMYCDKQLLNSGSEVAFLCCDALLLPFPTSSINAIVTDLPFGKKIGSVGDNRVIYPRLLVEWERVVKAGGRLIVMTRDKRTLALNGGRWRTTWRRMVNVGGLQALCSLLINTKNSQGFPS
ncbi:unnamed protein product [Angiostrongylus costaricensis]|uniref:THUMP domain-containing protein n=1 Tax=Angiostrongylus costaricensis TaxID=334426 RepID=A0A158PLJ6_ANGCS|nr:unnamed protein product [Angiostrongylus costaricensis]